MNRQEGIEKDIRVIKRVTVLYLALASIWILFSDAFLAWFAPDIALYSRLQTYKGWIFVLVTGSLFYFYLKPRIESLQMSQKALLQAKEELHENEMKYRELINGMSDTVWVIDFEAHIIDANDAAVKTLGYSREELLNMGPADIDGSLSQESITNLVTGMQADKTQVFETTHLTKDGKKIPVEIKSTLVNHKGEQAILSIARDITERTQARKNLEKHNTFVQAILDNLPIGLAVNDFDSGIADYMNARFSEIYGWPKEEISSVSRFFELVYPEPDYRKEIMDRIMSDIQSGDIDRMHWEDISIQTKDKGKRWVSAVNIPIIEQNIMVSTVQDVTERKHVEEELRRRLDYELATVECMRLLLEPEDMDTILPRILERVHHAVGDSRTYVFQNETDPQLGLCMSQIYEIVGEGVTEQIDNPLLKHLPYSEGSPTLLAVLQSRQHYAHLVEELGEPDRTILAEQGVLSVLILPIISGPELWGFIGFDDCVKARQWNEDDIKLLRVVADGIGETILRKAAENELKESEERFKALHNASFGGITIHDKGIILDCNLGLSEISGYGVEELIGMNGLLLIAEGYRDLVMKNILAGYEEPYEARGLRKDGTEYPLRLEARNIPYKGKQVRVVEFRDITEQKKAEYSLIKAKLMAEENNRIKSEFLANMSHELRTPLTAVIGFSDILNMQKFGELNSKQLEFTGHILNSGKHLLELINNILDLSKIEAGKMELYCEEFSVDHLLEEVQRVLYPLAARKNIEISVTNDVPHSGIFADKFKFKQIMYNLLSNAIKFTPDNGKVSVISRRDGNILEISVSDTGIGIPAHRQEEIFDPFMQVDASNKRKYGGTGLGLALVKRFVEMHDGKIHVESEEGQGSTFKFTIMDQGPAE